jgi:hypothetical protein
MWSICQQIKADFREVARLAGHDGIRIAKVVQLSETSHREGLVFTEQTFRVRHAQVMGAGALFVNRFRSLRGPVYLL